jgi:hypothetical protein
MGGGINLPNFLEVATGQIVTFFSSKPPDIDLPDAGVWTPPQYSQPALTILTVPLVTSNSSGQVTSAEINYVFDAVMKLSHHRQVEKTQHPVLTGANISDHAYNKPAQVILEIGMSDAMASFSNGVWVGASTKSVSAWQIIKSLQVNRTLITLTTRLDTYYNMLIVDAVSPDDNRTRHALKASITLSEVIAASVVSQQASSARPQTTSNTTTGIVQSTAPNSSQVLQNVIPSTLWPNTPTYPNIPGAGNVSSNNLGSSQ